MKDTFGHSGAWGIAAIMIVKRFWLLFAQVVTVVVGGLLAWKAVTPEVWAPLAQIVTVHEEGKPLPFTGPDTESFRATVQRALP